MQWMARGSNGGYFEMMVGLPRTPAHYYQSLSSPSLAPNPPPLRISTCPILKKYPPLLLLSAWTSSKPPPSLFSSNLLSSGAHQVATTPMYLFSAHCSVCTTDTPCIVCVRLHYLYTDLSIPHPPICPYYPAAQPRVIALLIISTQTANFKLVSSVFSQYAKLKIIPPAHHTTSQFPWLQFLHHNRNVVSHHT